MYDNEELIEAEQSAFLSAFAQGVFDEIEQKCGHCTRNSANGVTHELCFDTMQDFSMTLSGSDTDNGDCLTAFLFIGGDCYMCSSERCKSIDFRERIISLVCSLAGNDIAVRQSARKHRYMELEFFVLHDGEYRAVYSETKIRGLAARLFLWRDITEEKRYDLNFI